MTVKARIHRITPNAYRLRAIAEVVLDGSFVIHEIRVVEGQKGIFITMPSYKDRFGIYHEFCFPITAELHEAIESAVLEAYSAACAKLR